MIVDCAHYRDGRRQHEGPMDARARRGDLPGEDGGLRVARARSSRAPRSSPLVQDRFGLHDLAVEDAQSFHLRPEGRAVRRRGGVYFVVLRTARYDDEREEVEFGEVSVFLSRPLRHHGAPGRGQRPARRAAAARAPARAAAGGPGRGAVGDPRQGRRRLRAGGRGPRARHRGGRGDGLQRRGGADRAHLLPAPRGHRLLPRGAPAARPAGGGRARHLHHDRPGAGHYFRDVNDHLKLVDEEVARPARPARGDPAGQHGGGLGGPAARSACARTRRAGS